MYNRELGKVAGQIRYGTRENSRPMGDYAKCVSCAHEKALHTENGGCFMGDCSKFDMPMENDMIPGYDYATMTTQCQKCGHRATQLFMDGQCACACHTGMENTRCPVCVKEEGAALEEHLVTYHGMETDVASVVARDTEARSL